MHLVKIGARVFNIERITDAAFIPGDGDKAAELRIYYPYLNDNGEPALDYLEGVNAEALWNYISAGAVDALSRWLDRPI
jgi:hypothetical protein